MILIDSHCHLEPKSFPEAGEAIDRARANGVVHAVVVGQFHAPGDFGHALEVARAHRDFLTPTMGIHPHDAAAATEADWSALEAFCALPEVHAVGEAGLDFYYDHSPREIQGVAFRRQCQLAKRLQKPLVVHVRDAHPECIEILKSEGIRDGMIHCFTGDTDHARAYLDLGFHLSISGVVTYKKTEALQAAVQFAPLERLMVETDSPFLAPLPWRGKMNEPAYVGETAKKIAALQGKDAEVVALQCARNSKRVLRLTVNLE